MRHPANSMSTRQTVMKEPKKYQQGVIEFSYPSSKNGGMTFSAPTDVLLRVLAALSMYRKDSYSSIFSSVLFRDHALILGA